MMNEKYKDFKFNPNNYIDYLKDDLSNLYDNYLLYFKKGSNVSWADVDNAYDRFLTGLKSCDVKMHYRDIDLDDLKDYCWKLYNEVIQDHDNRLR